MTSPAVTCPRCLVALPADAPQGLCPKCLLAVSLGAPEVIVTRDGRPAPPPPTIAELAALFPQLEVLELVGRGGMGAVFKARQKGLNRLVALKVLAREHAADPAFEERFAREARALARLQHANIVAIHDSGRAGDRFYLLMEFVDGPNLRQVIRARTLKPAEALAIVTQVCAALAFAHEHGVVHRDIKPENVLLTRDGKVKIADFGLAKVLEPERRGETLTLASQAMGTPHYMAPEQVERPLDVDHRADIYSLGVVFYELLTGELPLGRFPLPSTMVQVDVRLDDIVVRSLEKEPERRYQHASQVKSAVEAVASSPGAGARAPKLTAPAGTSASVAAEAGALEHAARSDSRTRTVIAVAAAALVVLLVGGLILMYYVAVRSQRVALDQARRAEMMAVQARRGEELARAAAVDSGSVGYGERSAPAGVAPGTEDRERADLEAKLTRFLEAHKSARANAQGAPEDDEYLPESVRTNPSLATAAIPELQRAIGEARRALRRLPADLGRAPAWMDLNTAKTIDLSLESSVGVRDAADALLAYLQLLPGGALQRYLALERQSATIVRNPPGESEFSMTVPRIDAMTELESALWQEIVDAFGAEREGVVRGLGRLGFDRYAMPLGRSRVRVDFGETAFGFSISIRDLESSAGPTSGAFGATGSPQFQARILALHHSEMAKSKATHEPR